LLSEATARLFFSQVEDERSLEFASSLTGPLPGNSSTQLVQPAPSVMSVVPGDISVSISQEPVIIIAVHIISSRAIIFIRLPIVALVI